MLDRKVKDEKEGREKQYGKLEKMMAKMKETSQQTILKGWRNNNDD